MRTCCRSSRGRRREADSGRRESSPHDQLGRHLEVGDVEVLGESLAERGFPAGECAVAVGLGEQPSERRGGGLVGAGLLEAPRLAGDRVSPGVDVHPEGPARELLDVADGHFWRKREAPLTAEGGRRTLSGPSSDLSPAALIRSA